MNLIQTIKIDGLAARMNKETEKANLLTTLYSEASMIGKNKANRESTDEEVLGVVKKFMDNAKEVKDALLKAGNADRAAQYEREIKLLEVYAPTQLTEDELRAVIRDILDTTQAAKPNIGIVMKALKENYTGKYDGKMASTIATEMLKNGAVSNNQ